MNNKELIENYNLYKITDFEAAGFEQFVPDNGFMRYDMNSRGLRIWDKITKDYQCHVREKFRQKRIEFRVVYSISEINHGIVTNARDPVDKMLTKQFFLAGYKISRDDGPAILRLKKDGKILKAEWWKDNADITEDVEQWISENRLPALTKWNHDHIEAYRQAFFGNDSN